VANRKFTILFIGWMLVITISSLFSFSVEGEQRIWFPNMDKVVHFTFHFFIVLLGALASKEHLVNDWPWRKKIRSLLLLSIVYGLLIEFLQWAMPYGRAAEVWDVLANFSGALVGGLLIQKSQSLIDRLK